MKKRSKYLRHDLIIPLKSLPLKVKSIVEGYLTGEHRSPHHGFSVEFKEHRQYYPGDDLRYVDWKVYARTDRFYIKRFEEDTNMYVYVLLDVSGSMNYKGENSEITKLEYAKIFAGSLLYLTVLQNDSAGLITFSEDIMDFFPPRASLNYINDVLLKLENRAGEKKENFSIIGKKIIKRIKPRSLVILISDFIHPLEEIFKGINYLKGTSRRKNELKIVSINDIDEIKFDFKYRLYQFEDLESDFKIRSFPLQIRDEYIKRVQSHYNKLKSTVIKSGISFYMTTTSINILNSLKNFLIQ